MPSPSGSPPSAVGLVNRGWRILVVRGALVKDATDCLGPPDREASDGAAWDLARWGASGGEVIR